MFKSKACYKRLHWLWLSVCIIVLDQVTKQMALFFLFENKGIPLFSFFNLSLAFNRGAAFSFLNNAGGWQTLFFTSVALIFVAILVCYLLFCHSAYAACLIAFIIGGAMGNVIDRIHYGYVIDFIDWHIHDYHWPTFNIADSAICIGVVLFLITNFFSRNKENVS